MRILRVRPKRKGNEEEEALGGRKRGSKGPNVLTGRVCRAVSQPKASWPENVLNLSALATKRFWLWFRLQNSPLLKHNKRVLEAI